MSSRYLRSLECASTLMCIGCVEALDPLERQKGPVRQHQIRGPLCIWKTRVAAAPEQTQLERKEKKKGLMGKLGKKISIVDEGKTIDFTDLTRRITVAIKIKGLYQRVALLERNDLRSRPSHFSLDFFSLCHCWLCAASRRDVVCVCVCVFLMILFYVFFFRRWR